MSSEHDLLVFQRMKKALDGIKANEGMEVDFYGPLAEALDQLGCFPYAKVSFDSRDMDCNLSIAGKPAGTFKSPDIDLILRESTASSFGKGETTVLDPSYRNGKEIPAQNVEISKTHYFQYISEDDIAVTMFVGKIVKIKFYKLAVYQDGGHFDWHMDTTHSDRHHATFLLALNTSWEGGEFKLRRNGVETSVDMHPKTDRDGEGISLQGVAFYTDTEHKVESVTKGIRIILQYDVEVMEGDRAEEELLEQAESISKGRKRYQKTSGLLTADDAIVKKVTDIIESQLVGGDEEVAFAMQHLYRKSSILPEFLKGVDAQLYRALVNSFDVTLRPVVVHTKTDYDGSFEPWLAYPWNHKPGPESDSDSDNSGDSDDEYGSKTEKMSKKVFHLPALSSIRKLICEDYIEHTGNEAQPGDMKYFGGGIFVRRKKEVEKQ